MRTTADFIAEGERLSKLLDDALAFAKRQVKEAAITEAVYREAKSKAWVESAGDMLAKEREAFVDAVTAEKRSQRDIAEGMLRTAYEAIRSRRAQISLLQTFSNLERSEMELAR